MTNGNGESAAADDNLTLVVNLEGKVLAVGGGKAFIPTPQQEARIIANFLLELQGSAEDAISTLQEGSFDSEQEAMIIEIINELAWMYE